MSGTVRSEAAGNVCTLTLENEGKRNAISYSMLASLYDQIERIERSDDPVVLVLRGSGEKAFSAGADLTEAREQERSDLWERMGPTIRTYPYPTIALVNGHAFGGAVDLIASCDIRIGAADAKFGITPAKLGIVYDPTSIDRVMRVIGQAKTKELLFTGEAIDAEHAHEIGLLNHVFPPDVLESHTYEMAETIASNAPLSLAYMKEIIHDIQADRGISERTVERGRALRDEAFASEDYAEGVEAFSEGRAPNFRGR